MMKIFAMVMCMSVLVASQDFLGGDGLGGLMALNMLSGGGSPFNFNLFGGAPASQRMAGNAGITGNAGNAGNARITGASRRAGGYDPLTSLLVLGVL